MGADEGLPERLPPEDEAEFPNLFRTGYRVTSKNDPDYNCIAHAVGDKSQPWEPFYHWPAGASTDDGIESLRDMFEKLGYEVCDENDAEPGFDMVALYEDDEGYWTHAAKREDDGEWSSKLGQSFDIRHRSAHCFGGPNGYGNAVYFMRKEATTR